MPYSGTWSVGVTDTAKGSKLRLDDLTTIFVINRINYTFKIGLSAGA